MKNNKKRRINSKVNAELWKDVQKKKEIFQMWILPPEIDELERYNFACAQRSVLNLLQDLPIRRSKSPQLKKKHQG